MGLYFFLPCPIFSLRGKSDLREPYPRIIPRTIPPNHTPSHTPEKRKKESSRTADLVKASAKRACPAGNALNCVSPSSVLL